jgi:multiple sugar transport system ATP-binding protein
MAEVRLVEVSRQFQQQLAIDRISLQIPDGEFWVLVGGSGCGKSTILRGIAGLESFSSGQVYIGDRLVNDVPARDRDVAMVFQNYALYPHMTVAENLAFGLKMRQAKPEFIREQVPKAAAMLGISHLLNRLPRQLSGGQQQRVALGRAIVRNPQVFLLDEPLSNLDAQLRDETRAELKQLHQRVGITTIYVTHDQLEAMTLADKIVVLGEGKIQQVGTPAEIYDRPRNRLVASFMGNPPMNIWPGVYQPDGWQVGDQVIPATGNYALGQGCDLGLRPEKISLEILPDAVSLLVEVLLVEPLGRETLVKAQIRGSNIAIDLIAAPNWVEKPGVVFPVYFHLADLYFFDPTTGDRLPQCD